MQIYVFLGIRWEYKGALLERFRLAVKRVMSSPGDPSSRVSFGRPEAEHVGLGKTLTSQTPAWHHQLSMAETLVPNKDWFVSGRHSVRLRKPERVFMDIKSANVVMMLEEKALKRL